MALLGGEARSANCAVCGRAHYAVKPPPSNLGGKRCGPAPSTLAHQQACAELCWCVGVEP